MTTSKLVSFYSLCLSAGLALLPLTGACSNGVPQTSNDADTPAQPKVAPLFDSDRDYGRVQLSAFNTPEADGRPGEYYFDLGAQAAEKKDYAHAIAMYKVAASWAYKPAEYNLGVMYLRGQGTPVNLPRAMAWMALAAERNDPEYVHARELIYANLTPAQFDQANVIYRELLPTFGDAVALVRAKTRWREVLASATGSRVGSAAPPLKVGAIMGDPEHMRSPYYDVSSGQHISTTSFEVAGTHQTDGALAYQQLRAANNPYDPKFEWHPQSGTVSVKPLTPIETNPAGRSEKSRAPATTTVNGNQ